MVPFYFTDPTVGAPTVRLHFSERRLSDAWHVPTTEMPHGTVKASWNCLVPAIPRNLYVAHLL